MARNPSPGRVLLDTSGVVHQFHGHTLQQAAVREAVAGREVLGRLDIPRQGYDDDLLLDFYQRFKAVQEGVPDCRLCDFRKGPSASGCAAPRST